MVQYGETVLPDDRDQVEGKKDAQQYSLGLVKSKSKAQTVMPELQQRQGCRDGHSVGYELIRKGNRPIGTGHDETVVPVTSRARR